MITNNVHSFANVFKALRIHHRLTLYNISDMLTCRYGYIRRLDVGETRPSIRILAKYAELFNISIENIYYLATQHLHIILLILRLNSNDLLKSMQIPTKGICLANNIEDTYTNESYMELQSDYSEVLKLLRQTSYMSIERLSKVSKIQYDVISGYENGSIKVIPNHIKVYARIFNIDQDVINIYADRKYCGMSNFIPTLMKINSELTKQYKK